MKKIILDKDNSLVKDLVFITAQVDMPTKVTEEERTAVERVAKALDWFFTRPSNTTAGELLHWSKKLLDLGLMSKMRFNALKQLLPLWDEVPGPRRPCGDWPEEMHDRIHKDVGHDGPTPVTGRQRESKQDDKGVQE